MIRRITSTRLAALALGATTLALLCIGSPGPASAFGGDGPDYYERPAYGFRPPPPVFHGYWGQRRWHRYNDGYGFRPPPPPPGWGYGWR